MDDPKVSQLADHLGYWLRKVSNAVSGRFAAALAERGFTVAEWVALRELFEGDLQPSDLADRMGMTRGGITKLTSRMEARGLVLRRTDLDDGRAVMLALDQAGRAVTPDLARLADENERVFFEALPPADRDWLRRILGELARRHEIGASPVD